MSKVCVSCSRAAVILSGISVILYHHGNYLDTLSRVVNDSVRGIGETSIPLLMTLVLRNAASRYGKSFRTYRAPCAGTIQPSWHWRTSSDFLPSSILGLPGLHFACEPGA